MISECVSPVKDARHITHAESAAPSQSSRQSPSACACARASSPSGRSAPDGVVQPTPSRINLLVLRQPLKELLPHRIAKRRVRDDKATELTIQQRRIVQRLHSIRNQLPGLIHRKERTSHIPIAKRQVVKTDRVVERIKVRRIILAIEQNLHAIVKPHMLRDRRSLHNHIIRLPTATNFVIPSDQSINKPILQRVSRVEADEIDIELFFMSSRQICRSAHLPPNRARLRRHAPFRRQTIA